MKITCLHGSPRKGGTSSGIANELCRLLSERDGEITHYHLNEINFKGCQGCMLCKVRYDHCVINDALGEVLESVRASDLLIMASPVYFRDVTSQLKAFIDRTFSFVTPDYMTSPRPSRLSPGKKLVFIQTQALEEPVPVFEKYDGYYFRDKWGFDDTTLIRSCGIQESLDIRNHVETMTQIERAAAKIAVA